MDQIKMSEQLDSIINQFIKDLKSTPEYKQAWKTIPLVEHIVFDFSEKRFYDFWTWKMNNDRIPVCITMDEEKLLGLKNESE